MYSVSGGLCADIFFFFNFLRFIYGRSVYAVARLEVGGKCAGVDSPSTLWVLEIKRVVGVGGKTLYLLRYHVEPTWVFKPGARGVGRCPLERTEAMRMNRPLRRERGMALLLGILLGILMV